MFFSSIKKENRSRKDINRLSKGTSNIYLKLLLRKTDTQNFDFLNWKNLSQGQF